MIEVRVGPVVFEGKARQGLISALTPRIARAEQWTDEAVRRRLETAFPERFTGEKLARVLRVLVSLPWGDRRKSRRSRKRKRR